MLGSITEISVRRLAVIIQSLKIADRRRSPHIIAVLYLYREWSSDLWFYVTVIHGYLNVKVCFHATRQELSPVLYLHTATRSLDEDSNLWLVRVICHSILAACGHLRDKSDHVPGVICGFILTENDNLRWAKVICGYILIYYSILDFQLLKILHSAILSLFRLFVFTLKWLWWNNSTMIQLDIRGVTAHIVYVCR